MCAIRAIFTNNPRQPICGAVGRAATVGGMDTHPLVPASPPPAGPLTPAAPAHQQLLAAFLSGRSPRTLRASSRDLADFARWSGVCSSAEAVRLLLVAGHGGGDAAALAWRNGVAGRGLAPATVARRLAALRSLCRLALAPGAPQSARADPRGAGGLG